MAKKKTICESCIHYSQVEEEGAVHCLKTTNSEGIESEWNYISGSVCRLLDLNPIDVQKCTEYKSNIKQDEKN